MMVLFLKDSHSSHMELREILFRPMLFIGKDVTMTNVTIYKVSYKKDIIKRMLNGGIEGENISHNT